MLSILIFVLSSSLTFFFPLFLTYKASAQDQSSTAKLQLANTQLQFLAHYWVSYVLIIYIQNLFETRLLLSFDQNNVIAGLFMVVKLWLLFNHGCLVLNQVYGELIGSLIVPVSKSHQHIHLLKNSHPIQGIWLDTFERKFDPYFRSLLKSLISFTRIFGLSRLSVPYNLVRFQEYLKANPGSSFLQGSLVCLCFIDTPTELTSRYRPFHQFVNHVSNSTRKTSPGLLPKGQTSPPTLSPVSTQLHPTSSQQSSSQPISPQSAYKIRRSPFVSAKSSRSNSNNMAGEVFSPDKFSLDRFSDAISLNSSPSPSPPPPPVPQVSPPYDLPNTSQPVHRNSNSHSPRMYPQPMQSRSVSEQLNLNQPPPLPRKVDSQPQLLSSQPKVQQLPRESKSLHFETSSILSNGSSSATRNAIGPEIVARISSPEHSQKNLPKLPTSRPRSSSQPANPPYPLDAD